MDTEEMATEKQAAEDYGTFAHRADVVLNAYGGSLWAAEQETFDAIRAGDDSAALEALRRWSTLRDDVTGEGSIRAALERTKPLDDDMKACPDCREVVRQEFEEDRYVGPDDLPICPWHRARVQAGAYGEGVRIPVEGPDA